MFENIGEIVLLFWRTVLALPLAWRQRQKIFEQFFEIGNASLLMVCILSFFIGGGHPCRPARCWSEQSLASYLGGIVGIAIAKELAPVMMSILIAGRIGSAMAAEIGSMRVYQEIDALRTMNIDPIHYLVLPRLLRWPLRCRCWWFFPSSIGWFGGAVVAETNNHIAISFQAFFSDLRDIVEPKDVANGVFKSFCFALIIGVVSCHQGLDDHRRAARHRAFRHKGRREFHRADRDF